jgi:putative membrane protein
MLRRVLRHTPYAALCAAALVAGCAKGDKTADSARKADSAATAMTPPAPAMADTAHPAAAAPAMSDANIFATLDAANVADSSEGAIVAQKATSADVKAFGRQMMRDHHAMRKEGMDLAKKLNVTPQPPAGDNSAAMASAWRDSLTAMPKGPAFDKAYIDHAVADHQSVLTTLDAALASAQDPQLKDLLTKAKPKVQEHLDKAKAIQGKLGTA